MAPGVKWFPFLALMQTFAIDIATYLPNSYNFYLFRKRKKLKDFPHFFDILYQRVGVQFVIHTFGLIAHVHVIVFLHMTCFKLLVSVKQNNGGEKIIAASPWLLSHSGNSVGNASDGARRCDDFPFSLSQHARARWTLSAAHVH